MASESEELDFPGLNKRHGFFKVIERNQRDRDDYHQKVEQIKQARHEEMKKEKRAKRKPPTELYRPPGSRTREQNPECGDGLYCVEIEVAPDRWHRQVVEKVGQADRTSRGICRQYRLDKAQQEAIAEMIEEFETNLNL